MEEEDDKAAKVKVKNIFKKLCLPKVKLLELPKPQTAGPLNYLLVKAHQAGLDNLQKQCKICPLDVI